MVLQTLKLIYTVYMSTNSHIGIINLDGTVETIYCHFDGYIDGVGKTLFHYYYTENKVRELLTLGSLSSLGSLIGEKHKIGRSPNHDWCVSYLRDRGESDSTSRRFDCLASANLDREYTYLFDVKTNSWIVKYNNNDFIPLVFNMDK
jgi:hypothetical protein